jgi:Fe-S cluster biogenesis protein NfuA
MSQVPIDIYFEQTPNPESLKFVTNQVLLPNIVFESKRNQNDGKSPLANALYEKFEWIQGVFISNNFITISKSDQNDWYEYMHDAKEYLKMYFQNRFEVVLPEYLDAKLEEYNQEISTNTIEGKIIDLLEKYVKPAVQNDGGFISFKSFDNGIVTLSMQGSCSGCPSSQVTLKSGIEGLLKRMVPEVLEVVAEAN